MHVPSEVRDDVIRLRLIDLFAGVRSDQPQGLAPSSPSAADTCRRILDNQAPRGVDAGTLSTQQVGIRSGKI